MVNVYRTPRGGRPSPDTQALEVLFTWTPPPLTIIAGGFNAHHHNWQPDADPSGPGTQLADWMQEHELALLSPPGQPTHRRGNTLDLAFDVPLANTMIEGHLGVASDHCTLATTVPLAATCAPPLATPVVSGEEELQRFDVHVAMALSATQPLKTTPSPGELD